MGHNVGLAPATCLMTVSTCSAGSNNKVEARKDSFKGHVGVEETGVGSDSKRNMFILPSEYRNRAQEPTETTRMIFVTP